MSENVQNKNSKISIGFFSLQGKPELLMPWIVFTILFLVANTVPFIVYAVQTSAIYYTANGVEYIVGVLIYICK